jgi:hypothetical protein
MDLGNNLRVQILHKVLYLSRITLGLSIIIQIFLLQILLKVLYFLTTQPEQVRQRRSLVSPDSPSKSYTFLNSKNPNVRTKNMY